MTDPLHDDAPGSKLLGEIELGSLVGQRHSYASTKHNPSSPLASYPFESKPDSQDSQIQVFENALSTPNPSSSSLSPPLAPRDSQQDNDEQRIEENADDEEATTYPSGWKLAVIVIGMALAVLCVALDNTILATAIPKITDEFHAVDDVGWYGSAFLLTLSASQLFFGRLYSIFNAKWVFLFSLFIFELGSLLCGIAPNSLTLIVGRAIAGLGASGLFSGAFIIIGLTVALEKRPLYISLVSSVYAISSVLGPLLGGVFTDLATWRWCFYINLPFGGITAFAVVFFVHVQRPPESGAKKPWRDTLAQFDPLGTIVFIPCIICLLLALQWGGSTYAWASARIIALFVVFGVLLLSFVGIQIWAGDYATIPVRVATQRSMAFASLFTLCLSASFFIIVYYVPFWFQAIRGETATRSGINTLPLTMSAVVGTMIGGIGTTKLGYYAPFMLVASALGAIGSGLIYTWTVDTTIARTVGYQLIFGFGTGLGLQQNIVAAQTVLEAVDVPVGTSIAIFAQSFGGALFISAAQNSFINRLASNVKGISGIDPAKIISSGATDIIKLTDDPSLLRQIQVAYNDALSRTYLVATVLVGISMIGAIGVEWKSVKTQSAPEKDVSTQRTHNGVSVTSQEPKADQSASI
ncbi:hypothetical protein TrVGV298_009677 [Trichoderma virens]|nr:hypothetical protein TrVGV298_009677 [Trichoderma virens]